LARERPQVGGGRRIECGAERIPQALEQDQLLRIVFAKKSEKTGSTAFDAHFGHLGRALLERSVIFSVRANRAWHAVQRYSYSGMPQRIPAENTGQVDALAAVHRLLECVSAR
jgi:hypothetical protein